MAGAVFGAAGAKLGGLAAGTFGWSAGTWSQIGWTAGVLVGNYLFSSGPDLEQEGPRLDDLKVTTSTYGMPISRVFGSYRFSGNIFWAIPLVETKHEEREDTGKGGSGGSSTSTWYSYAGTWAVGLCEGEVKSIKKIWFGSSLVYNNGRYGGSLAPGNLTIYLGSNTQSVNWRMQANKGDSPAYRNLCYLMFNNVQLEDYGDIIPSVTCEVEFEEDQTLEEVTTSILLSCGVESNEIDATAGSSQIVKGYLVGDNMSARAMLEPLLSAYNFSLVEKDFKLVLVSRQQNSIANIPEDHLGSNTENLLEYSVSQESDLFKSITVKYANNESDYQTSVQQSLRIDTNATEEAIVELPLALTDDEAKQLTEKHLYENWLNRQKFIFNLPSFYYYLAPGDVITLNYNGYIKDVKLSQVTFTEDTILNCSAVANNYGVYNSDSDGSDTGDNGSDLSPGQTFYGTVTGLNSQVEVIDSNRIDDDFSFDGLTIEFTSGDYDGERSFINDYYNNTFYIESMPSPYGELIAIGDSYKIYNDTILLLLDIPTISNTLINTSTIYVAASGTNKNWKGTSVYSKSQAQDDFSEDLVVLNEATHGIVQNTLGDHNTYHFDYDNEIIVKPYHNIPESSTEDLVLKGFNYCIVGEEVLQFVDVLDNLDGTYTLSTLLRGRRGTETKTGIHGVNEAFVILSTNTISNITKGIGSNNYYGSVSLGLNDIIEYGKFFYSGENLKTFSPSYFRGMRAGSDISLVWMRRDRYISGYFKTLPLSESVEKYTLEVYDSSDVLIETIKDILDSSYLYDTTTYFGINDEVRFKVYQVSSVTQEGYPSEYLKVI